MTKFDEIKKQVQKILLKSPLDFEVTHSGLVLKWVLKLKPDADEALKISAISHDIDRAVTGITEKDLKDYSKIDEFKKAHSIRSAKFIVEILKMNNYSSNIVKKVKHLVENHEFGGDPDTDILKDADSIAYFEYNIPSYLKRNGQQRTEEKIRFMYKRLSPKGKKMMKEVKYKDKHISSIVKQSLSKLKK